MTEPPAPAAHPRDDAVIDLLGALSYAQLTGFQALASAAGRAPDLRTTTSFARLAVAMFSRFERVGARLAGLGVAQPDAMAPFVAAIDAFHARTAPSDWLEAIVKAYVGDGIVRDFYTQMAAHLDPDNRDFVVRLIGDAGAAETIVALVRPVIAADPRAAGRLALWARRIMGEAVQQTQSVAVERPSLTALLVGGEPGSDVAEVGRMFGRIAEAHTARMQSLGLAS
jgi:hypothetical protein